MLGDEILGFAPSGIRLTVPGEGGQVGHGQHAHGFQRSRQPFPFLFRFGEQPRRALYAALGRDGLMLVDWPPPLAPVAFQHLQRRGLRLSACHRHKNRLPSAICRISETPCKAIAQQSVRTVLLLSFVSTPVPALRRCSGHIRQTYIPFRHFWLEQLRQSWNNTPGGYRADRF